MLSRRFHLVGLGPTGFGLSGDPVEIQWIWVLVFAWFILLFCLGMVHVDHCYYVLNFDESLIECSPP